MTLIVYLILREVYAILVFKSHKPILIIQSIISQLLWTA